jgi:hypothetical protein
MRMRTCVPMQAGQGVRVIRTREAVAALREQDLSATRIAAELGVSKSTVCSCRVGDGPL